MFQTWRVAVVNNTGQQLDFSSNSANEEVTVKVQLWKYDSGGMVTWGDETTILSAATDLADGADEQGTTQDNSSNRWLGFDGNLYFKSDNATMAGDVTIAIEGSTDGGTTWPSASADFDPDSEYAAVLAVVTAAETTKDEVRVPLSYRF